MAFEEHIWTEKHRPEGLNEVIGHTEQVDRLRTWITDESVPHLLLHGPAGTGKTASVVAFARDKYGDGWRGNLIEMNASDERGIDVVRDQIKARAQEAPSGDYGFKIIYLDEADNLTKDAQAALRRVMEEYSDRTRFFLSCNYPNKLIDPIQSRCTPLPFDRLEEEQIEQLLRGILERENVDYEENAVRKIIEYVEGDARRAVQTLQTSVEDGELTEEVIDVVGGEVDREVVEDMIDLAQKGEIDDAQSLVVNEVLPEVTDYSRFVKTLMRTLQNTDNLPDDVRWYALSQLGEVERNIIEGCNPHVQINSFIASVPVIRHASIPNYQE